MEFRKISDIAEKDPGKFIGNPVNSFYLVKMLSKDLNQLLGKLQSSERLKGIEIKKKNLEKKKIF